MVNSLFRLCRRPSIDGLEVIVLNVNDATDSILHDIKTVVEHFDQPHPVAALLDNTLGDSHNTYSLVRFAINGAPLTRSLPTTVVAGIAASPSIPPGVAGTNVRVAADKLAFEDRKTTELKQQKIDAMQKSKEKQQKSELLRKMRGEQIVQQVSRLSDADQKNALIGRRAARSPGRSSDHPPPPPVWP